MVRRRVTARWGAALVMLAAVAAGSFALHGGRWTAQATNRSPVTVDDVYYLSSLTTDLAVSASGVLSNDSDPDNDTLTATILSQPLYGVVTLDQNGGFQYAGGPTFLDHGIDSFIYRPFDGKDNGPQATVYLYISGYTCPGNTYCHVGPQAVHKCPAGQSLECPGWVYGACSANYPGEPAVKGACCRCVSSGAGSSASASSAAVPTGPIYGCLTKGEACVVCKSVDECINMGAYPISSDFENCSYVACGAIDPGGGSSSSGGSSSKAACVADRMKVDITSVLGTSHPYSLLVGGATTGDDAWFNMTQNGQAIIDPVRTPDSKLAADRAKGYVNFHMRNAGAAVGVQGTITIEGGDGVFIDKGSPAIGNPYASMTLDSSNFGGPPDFIRVTGPRTATFSMYGNSPGDSLYLKIGCQEDVVAGCGNGAPDAGEQCGEPGLTCAGGQTCNENTCACTGGATCGNNVVDPGEECRDGGLTCPSGSACNNQACVCSQSPQCGDGTVNAGEQCNEPGLSCGAGQSCNVNSCVCSKKPPVCGDGTADTGEQCRDGGLTCSAGKTCNNATCLCTGGPSCGNGVVDPGEECRDGGLACPAASNCNTPTCTCFDNPQCGNGIINAGEKCGEPGLTCGAGQVCNQSACVCSQKPPVCGDGTADPGEQCRDGGLTCSGGQTCNNATCQCTGGPLCGNGALDPGEQCRDGGQTCPTGSTCNNATCICSHGPLCGNGAVDAGEKCNEPGLTCQASHTCDTNACVCTSKNQPGSSSSSSSAAASSVPANVFSYCCSPFGTPENCMQIPTLPGQEGLDPLNYCADNLGVYKYYDNSADPANSCKQLCPSTTTCGNDILEGFEQCDDGNQNNNDQCTNSCRLTCTPGSTCPNGALCSANGVCPISCGDGNIDNGEECDLGSQNGQPNSGCTSICTLSGCTPGSTCPNGALCPANGVCPTSCGDGNIDNGEECDSGSLNGAPGNLCLADCTVNNSNGSSSSGGTQNPGGIVGCCSPTGVYAFGPLVEPTCDPEIDECFSEVFGSCIADGGTEVQISSPLLDYITSGKAEEDTQGCQQTPPPVPSHYKCDRRITAEEGGNMCSAYNRQVDGLGTLTILSSSKFSPRDTVCDPTCERLKSFADCCHPDVCQTEIPEECVTAGGIPFVYDVTGGETLCESMRQQGLCDE